MLKFLTHKLRTHSLNDDPNQDKADDNHDSGTESDDEFQEGSIIGNEPSSPMGSPASPGTTDSAVPSDSDFGASTTSFGFLQREPSEEDDNLETRLHPLPMASAVAARLHSCQSRESELLSLSYNDQHSSEEELEVINSPKVVASQGCRPATAPEKRKWSQVSSSSSSLAHCSQMQSSQSGQSQSQAGLEVPTIVSTSSAPVSRAGTEPAGSGSSDEEVQGLLDSRSNGSVISQPVQFRTSPPIDAHKPGRSLSPPPKLFHASTRDPRSQPRPRSRPRHHHPHLYHHYYHHHYQMETDVDTLSACSPRKRHRPPHRQPRPCLDFEKMQQLKTRAVTTWRHSGDHGSEVSVFCW